MCEKKRGAVPARQQRTVGCFVRSPIARGPPARPDAYPPISYHADSEPDSDHPKTRGLDAVVGPEAENNGIASLRLACDRMKDNEGKGEAMRLWVRDRVAGETYTCTYFLLLASCFLSRREGRPRPAFPSLLRKNSHSSEGGGRLDVCILAARHNMLHGSEGKGKGEAMRLRVRARFAGNLGLLLLASCFLSRREGLTLPRIEAPRKEDRAGPVGLYLHAYSSLER
ncbi:hypothetical protein B0H14DRAFT_3145140 [Mycena olivaceomarginata]|nr:hypothetical protein B0H14DRAFT_3145140 [Mycena olivaceomarginata]